MKKCFYLLWMLAFVSLHAHAGCTSVPNNNNSQNSNQTKSKSSSENAIKNSSKKCSGSTQMSNPGVCIINENECVDLEVGYLGGFMGPTNRVFAVESFVPLSTNAVEPGKLHLSPLRWGNGFFARFAYRGKVDDPTFFAEFSFFTRDYATSSKEVKVSEPSMVSTHAIDIVTGDTADVYKATGKYKCNSNFAGSVLVTRDYIVGNELALTGFIGATVSYLHQSQDAYYSQNIASTEVKTFYYLHEKRIAGGPKCQLLVSKGFGECVGFQGILATYAMISSHRFSCTNKYQDGSGPYYYGINVHHEHDNMEVFGGFDIGVKLFLSFQADTANYQIFSTLKGNIEPCSSYISSFPGRSMGLKTTMANLLLEVGFNASF